MKKHRFIRLGDFLFRYRNFIIPVVLAVLLLAFPPVGGYPGSVQAVAGMDVLAIFLVVAGLVLRSIVIGLAYIKRGGLNKQVYANRLVTRGFFGVCRNPLYLFNMMLYTGLLLLHGHPAVIVTGGLILYIIYASIIAAEEYYLNRTFGSEYTDYCTSVSRWIPDFTRYKMATEGLSFRPTRALFKDYTTVFNVAIAVIAIELIKISRYAPGQDFAHALHHSIYIIGILVLSVLVIKIVKKYGLVRTDP